LIRIVIYLLLLDKTYLFFALLNLTLTLTLALALALALALTLTLTLTTALTLTLTLTLSYCVPVLYQDLLVNTHTAHTKQTHTSRTHTPARHTYAHEDIHTHTHPNSAHTVRAQHNTLTHTPCLT
jgi:hypothetical protein